MSDYKYIQSWLPHDKTLLPFYEGVDNFLKDFLPAEVFNIQKRPSKIIADPLLGYIYLTPLEIAIIDTPLFQRLRKIKQLGLAYLVFPSLGYTRFEHSLGVLGRLNQIINKLIENYNRDNPKTNLETVINDHIDSLRLAALLHDIGHCLFSHCSERVVHTLNGDGTYPSSHTIREKFTKSFKKDNSENLIPFAELFSVAILGSKRFCDYITGLNVYKPLDVETVLYKTARFILGMPVDDDPDTIFMFQLISSGIDADKIDYMVREQTYSGIKLEIDLDRIFSKINVFDIHPYELPKNLEHLKSQFNDNVKIKVLGFSKGGQFVFEEFCIARLALHVKIYLHQKVRAAEAQLAKYLYDLSQNEDSLTKNRDLQKAHNWLRLTENVIETPEIVDKILGMPEGLFLGGFLKKQQIDDLKKINERKLYLRAYAFGQINSFSEPAKSAGVTDENLENFFENFNEDDLKSAIVNECLEIFHLQGLETYGIQADDFNNIIVDIPHLRFKSIQQGQESIHFERPPLAPLKWTIPLDKIVIYFEENRALGYIFSPPNIASTVNIASEKVIFEQTKKVFDQDGNISKHTFDDAKRIKKWLTESDYYKNIPQLKEISEYLKRADASEKIKKLHEKLSNFNSLSKERITVNRIVTFVNQFPTSLQEVCLNFLQEIEVYDETLLKEQLQDVLRSLMNVPNVGVTYLGGTVDSSAHLGYHMRSLTDEFNIDIREVNNDLVLESDVLVFYDDNINSGLQLINIMAQLLNETSSLGNYYLDEKHVRPLTDQKAKEKIKAMPLHFCYTIGFENIEKTIKSILHEVLEFNPDNIHVHVKKEFKYDEKIFTGPNSRFDKEKKRELREYLEKIGYQLLLNDGKPADKAKDRALGYANAEAVVLFPYNVPTMTITALWFNGVIDDMVPWIPLAERRRRSIRKGDSITED